MKQTTPTFQELASRWLSEMGRQVAPATVDSYRQSLEKYVYPVLGGRLDISEEEVKALMDGLLEQGLSEHTVFMLPRLINRILSYASAEGLCPPPQWEMVLGAARSKRSAVTLTAEEERTLLSYLQEHPSPMHLGLYLMLTAGLIRKEVVALTWADVSLYQKQMQVQDRTVPLNERQRLYLKQMQAGPGIYVASGKDKPIWGCNLAPALNAVAQELLLPPVVPSDLRRTFAVRSLENGMGYEELSRVLGVKNSSNFRAQFQVPGTHRSPGKGPETRQPDAQDVLGYFHQLTARILELDPAPEAHRRGRPRKPTLENEFKRAMKALDRLKG